MHEPELQKPGTGDWTREDGLLHHAAGISERSYQVIILTISVVVILFSVYCLSHGITIIFMHLYYLPIVLLAYRYRYKGFVLSGIISLIYIGLVLLYSPGQDEVIIGALIRFVVFIGIAAVVAYLSEQFIQSEKSLKKVVDIQESSLMNANVWLMLLDTRGRVLLWNNAAERISGYAAVEVTGSNDIWKLLYPDKEYRAGITKKIGKIIAEDSFFENLETKIRTRSGEEKVISWNTRNFPVTSGQDARSIAIGIDITGRKRAEDALRKNAEELHAAYEELTASQQELRANLFELTRQEMALRTLNIYNRSLLEASLDPLVTINSDGKIADVNISTELATGYSREELIGSDFSDNFTEPEQAKEGYQRVFTDGIVRDYPLSIRNRDGHITPVLYNATVYRDEAGNVSGVFAAARDITERKRVEEALKRSEIKYRALFDNSSDAILIHDMTGRILDVNQVLCDRLGYSREELLQMTPMDFDSPEYAGLVPERLRQLMNSKHQIFETCNVRKDGTCIPTEINVRIIEYEGVQVCLSVGRDITERKVAEVALQHQSATLSILNAIISTANKADDLPELLTSILEESLHLLDFDVGGIYLVDRSTRTAHVVHSKNLPEEFLAEIQPLAIDTKPYDTLFIKNEPIITENYAQIAPGRSEKYGFLSMASIPLLSKGVAIGALNLASKRRQVISEEEKQTLISISRELGSTIERMAAEREVKNAAKNFKTLFNSIDDMVFVLDMKGCILAVNDTVQKRLSYTQRELTGTNVLLLHVPERRDEALKIIVGITAETTDSCSVPVLTKDGMRIEVETKVTRGWWNGNEVLIGVSRDVTERKVAENALLRVNQKLNVISQLTRKDLTNQTFVLSSYLELAKDQLDGQDQVIATLQKGVQAVQLIHATIEYSKDYQDMGAKPPKWQNVKMEMLFGLSHISIGNIRHSLETEDLEIFADPLLEKVCQRLFENSVKHGGHVTRIRIWYTVTPDRATIFFEDDGIGIPQEKKEQIFLRGDGTRATTRSLIFVREILDITGITINETGEPGQGVRFEMVVPKGVWRTAGRGDA
ncbi:MAG: PAS domain S-box protein [Methanomicrobiales archaeon]|nr:PAS domain S-box protein [Methanomicrobiales archaeon]